MTSATAELDSGLGDFPFTMSSISCRGEKRKCEALNLSAVILVVLVVNLRDSSINTEVVGLTACVQHRCWVGKTWAQFFTAHLGEQFLNLFTFY